VGFHINFSGIKLLYLWSFFFFDIIWNVKKITIKSDAIVVMNLAVEKESVVIVSVFICLQENCLLVVFLMMWKRHLTGVLRSLQNL